MIKGKSATEEQTKFLIKKTKKRQGKIKKPLTIYSTESGPSRAAYKSSKYHMVLSAVFIKGNIR